MAVRSIRRQATNPGGYVGAANAAPVYVDSDTNTLKYVPGGAGSSTEVEIVDVSATQTFTNKTLTSPAINTPTINSGAAMAATSTEVDRVADVSTRLVAHTGTALSATEASHDGRIIYATHTAAASTVTLPASSGGGAKFKVVVGAVNTNNHVIKVANSTDVMYGNIITNSTGDTPDLAQPWPTAADSDTITLNGTTTGGAAVGDFVDLIDVAAGKWLVFGVTTTTSTEATPFSATV